MFMNRFVPQTYALMRMVVGFLFLWHGAQKLFGFPLPPMEGVPALVTFTAGPIELVGGAMVAIGLFTRWAAFLSSGLMAAGYWMAHGMATAHFTAHGMSALLPLVNGGELAAFYCFVFLFIAAFGPGIWSVDAVCCKGGKCCPSKTPGE